MIKLLRALVFLGIVILLSLGAFQTKAADSCADSFVYSDCPETFSDILDHSYGEAIYYVKTNSIVSGYPDGTYKPDNKINRAEFTKIIMETIFGTPEEPEFDCFPDVPKKEWHAKYICEALKRKIIEGYPDGSFKPTNTINFA